MVQKQANKEFEYCPDGLILYNLVGKKPRKSIKLLLVNPAVFQITNI